MRQFQNINKANWEQVMYDPCTQDWKKNWMLDGLMGKIENSDKGMDFWAGPTFQNDACHAVLWTRQSFKGNIKIEYEYTKLDKATKCVTILYIQATGSDVNPFKKDIALWANLRDIPAMRLYFDNMNTYHISYAAYENNNDDPAEDYIRARRYLPNAEKGLSDTDLQPAYFRTGLFETGVPYKIKVIKRKNDLFMYIHNSTKALLCHWKNDKALPIIEGRIGLRHMFTRGARYRNFQIYTLKE